MPIFYAAFAAAWAWGVWIAYHTSGLSAAWLTAVIPPAFFYWALDVAVKQGWTHPFVLLSGFALGGPMLYSLVKRKNPYVGT